MTKNNLKMGILFILFLSFGWFGSSQVDEKEQSIKALLVQLGSSFFSPSAEDFLLKTQKMTSDIEKLCEAYELGEQTENLKNQAQDSWLNAMQAYHFILAAPFGPLYENSRQLSNAIYSWPLMFECGFQTEMISLKETGEFTPKSLYTTKGLMAVEFALFGDLNSTTCNTKNKKFAKVHDWLKLDESEKAKDICRLGLASSKEVQVNSESLSQRWNSSQGDFTSEMVKSQSLPELKKTLNTITDGLFTTLEIAKDLQLGKPTGLHKDCLNADGKCVDDVEHKWSQTGLESLEAQFLGLQSLFNDGGFELYLKSNGLEDIYSAVISQNEVILASIEKLKTQGSLNQLVKDLDPALCEQTTDTNNLVPLCGLQRQIRSLVQIFREDLFPALQLNAPAVYQMDAD